MASQTLCHNFLYKVVGQVTETSRGYKYSKALEFIFQPMCQVMWHALGVKTS